MKTKTITVYSFAELDDDAKDRAMSYMRENWNLGEECVTEGMETINKGLKAFNASLDGSYSIDFTENYRSHYRIELNSNDSEISGLRLRKFILNNFYKVLFGPKHYGGFFKGEDGKYIYPRYSRILKQESDCPFTGMSYDYNFLDPIRKFLKSPSETTTWKELLTDCVENVISVVGKEIEYRNGEEAIAEMCKANEYEFDENGKLI